MGEDVGKLGGVFRITDGLQKDFGEERVIDTPLAESGIIGTAVGLAIRGYRPVCEIQFDGFVFPAYNQIVTQVANAPRRPRHRGPERLRHRRVRRAPRANKRQPRFDSCRAAAASALGGASTMRPLSSSFLRPVAGRRSPRSTPR